MFATFYQNKCSKFSIIFLSKVVVKKTWVMQRYKKMDTKEVQSKKKGEKEKKEKEMRIKITHVLAKIFHKRNIFQRA